MKTMKKLAMSLALGLGLSLLGGGQGTVASQTNHRVLIPQPEVHGTLIDRDTDVILFEINELRNRNKKKKKENYDNLRKGGLSENQAKKQARGPFDCGNVLVAHVNVKNFPWPCYIVLQSGLARNASAELNKRLQGNILRESYVFDGADVIKRVSGKFGVVADDIRILAGGGDLVGEGDNPDEDVKARLQAIVQALRTYAVKCQDQNNGFATRPIWARQTNGCGITTQNGYVCLNNGGNQDSSWVGNTITFLDRINGAPNLQDILKKILARLLNNSDQDRSGVFDSYCCNNQGKWQRFQRPLNDYSCAQGNDHDYGNIQTNWWYRFPYKGQPAIFNWDCAWDCARLLGINNFNENLFLGYNALRWFKYALHTEIQLALLICSGMKLVPHSPILSLKDPCPSCEQGANDAWNHQDHKFFSIQGDSQGDNHEFSTRDGTIIETRYCTWK